MDYYQTFVEVAKLFSKAIPFLGWGTLVIATLLSIQERNFVWLIFNLIYFALALFGLFH